MERDNERLVCVFATGNKGAFLIAKSLLDDAGINYTTRNAGMRGTLYSTSLEGRRLLALQEDEQEAKEVLRDLKESQETQSEKDDVVEMEDSPSLINDAVKYDPGLGLKLLLIVLAILIIVAVIFLVKK